MVQEMHEDGKIVVVWVDTTAPKEIYEEKKAMIENLKRKQDEGEDISKMIADLGLGEYFN